MAFQSFPKFSKVFQSFPKLSKVAQRCPNLSKHVNCCQMHHHHSPGPGFESQPTQSPFHQVTGNPDPTARWQCSQYSSFNDCGPLCSAWHCQSWSSAAFGRRNVGKIASLGNGALKLVGSLVDGRPLCFPWCAVSAICFGFSSKPETEAARYLPKFPRKADPPNHPDASYPLLFSPESDEVSRMRSVRMSSVGCHHQLLKRPGSQLTN